PSYGLDSQWHETEINEPLRLNWSLTDWSDRLVPGVRARLNVFSVHESHQYLWEPDVNPKPNYMFQEMSQDGSYRFEIRITGTDCEPVDIAVEGERGESWDKPILKLIKLGDGQ